MDQKALPHTSTRGLIAATVLGLAFAGRTGANAEPQSIPADAPRSRLVASQAGAWNTTSLFGGATGAGRGALIFQLGWRRTLSERGGVLLEYAPDIVPLELAFGTRVMERPRPSGGEKVYGAGLDPLGIEARFGHGRLRPYAALRTGFRIFTEPVPTPRGTRFNFALDAGGGLELRVRENRWAFVGVDLHHLSNGGLGEANPSLNLFTLRAGLALRR